MTTAVLHTTDDIHWATAPNTLTLHAGTTVPDPVTAASAFVHHDGHLVLVDVISRGWDLPGGRLEEGETPSDALPREILEEAGVALGDAPVRSVGFTHLHSAAPRPQGSRWPHPDTHQMFYSVQLPERAALGTLVPQEIRDAHWVPLDQVAATAGVRAWTPLFHYLRELGEFTS